MGKQHALHAAAVGEPQQHAGTAVGRRILRGDLGNALESPIERRQRAARRPRQSEPGPFRQRGDAPAGEPVAQHVGDVSRACAGTPQRLERFVHPRIQVSCILSSSPISLAIDDAGRVALP